LTSEPVQNEAISFSETNSAESSIVSEEGDIITIVTTDIVSASVLHADSDASSICVDQEEQTVTSLYSPSKSIVTLQDIDDVDTVNIVQARTDGNKKSVRFQDSTQDYDVNLGKVLQSSSTAVAPDTVPVYVYVYFISVLYVCMYVHMYVHMYMCTYMRTYIPYSAKRWYEKILVSLANLEQFFKVLPTQIYLIKLQIDYNYQDKIHWAKTCLMST